MQIARLSNLMQTIARRLGRKERLTDEAELSDVSDVSDLSYEDALLDVQVRSFFHAEYVKPGNDEAPHDIFPQLVHSIRVYNQSQEQDRRAQTSFKGRLAQALSQLGQATGAIYRLGSRPGMRRSLSGSLVTALLVLAIAPILVQSLNGRSIGSMLGSSGNNAPAPQLLPGTETTPTPSLPFSPGQKASSDIRKEQAQLLLEQRFGEDFDAQETIQVEDDALYPAELRNAPKKASRNPDEPVRPRPINGED